MGLVIQVLSYLLALPLQLLAIAGLLRGPYRQYPFVFIYVIADFLAAVVEMLPALAYYHGNKRVGQEMANFYWIDEVILQVLVYAAVISLLYYATSSVRTRRILRLSLITFAVVFAGVSFVVHYDHSVKTGEWMTPWSSNLNFCAAILDLALWALLIASRVADRRLLTLSGALGIQFTGQAIGQSLRNVAQRSHTHSYPLLYGGDAVAMLTYLGFLYILWQAFRPAKVRKPVAHQVKEPPAIAGGSIPKPS